MFTGIVETLAEVISVTTDRSNLIFTLRSTLAASLRVDQSVSHDGVCLTVTSVQDDTYTVTAIAETLSRTALSEWEAGRLINLERSMQLNGRIDGHLVQGHVDAVGVLHAIEEAGGSRVFRFTYPGNYDPLLVEKGSVCVNGVSLTVAATGAGWFTVALIPYTLEHTNLGKMRIGSAVNLEFDVLGKYVLKAMGREFKEKG